MNIKEFKEQVVVFLKDHLSDDTVDIIDVFRYDGNRSLQLTHYGYRNLKDHYEFHEIEFMIVNDVRHYIAVTKAIDGLFYLTVNKKDSTMKVLTTDRKFVNRIKISGFSFEMTLNKFSPTKEK